ncbi:DUF6069 family protein [Micromonospora sp. R77]|uniref:DUF6069 family protein n=1 Tax=Micromonospora sp. R77 TaxID=2925836 RepID=UPI001F61DE75|nr:DUF6069 family protein [Micromonospora sp. R77]MCI4066649.1 DUF6069 family protein [Micromonospora sp. R77]
MSATAHPATGMSLMRRRALGVAAAVLACVLIWVLGRIAGVDYTVTNPGQPAMDVGVGSVVIFSLVASLVGWAALIALERFTSRATAIWTALAVVVALLSLLPLAGSEADGSTKLTLGAMHLAVAAVLIALLPARNR